MGISGLLPMLKEIQEVKHLKDYRGKTLGIDAYVLLHKGVYSCAQEVALNQPTLKYVSYCMGKIRTLQHFGITPYVVLDGANLPSKSGTESSRQASRADALAKANMYLSQGNTPAARDMFIKACDVTPKHAYQLIKELKRAGISYVVAPYEADAQLCYLERQGLIDGILTEDSDLLVFGCQTVLFKWDADGRVTEIRRDRLTACKEFRFDGWTDTDFRHMAILSGCDYIDAISGIGIKSAHQLMRKYKSSKRTIQSIRLNAKLTVPRDYEKAFKRADLTFQHQFVFDPVNKKAIHLSDPALDVLSTEDYIAVGGGVSHELAAKIASGDIDPLTKKEMVDIFPDAAQTIQIANKASSSSSLYRTENKKLSHVEKGARDIRNFFGGPSTTAPSSQSTKRKPLSQQCPNSPPAKRRKTEDMPSIASKFFSQSGKLQKTASHTFAEVETILLSSDDEEEDGNMPEGESIDSLTKEALHLVDFSEAETEEAEAAWTVAHDEQEETTDAAQPMTLDQLDDVEVAPNTAEDLGAAPRALVHSLGADLSDNITSPASSLRIQAKSDYPEASSSVHFLSSPSNLRLEACHEQDSVDEDTLEPADFGGSGTPTAEYGHIGSDETDISEPKTPPAIAKQSKKAKTIKSEPKKILKSERPNDEEAIKIVAASWRARFMNSAGSSKRPSLEAAVENAAKLKMSSSPSLCKVPPKLVEKKALPKMTTKLSTKSSRKEKAFVPLFVDDVAGESSSPQAWHKVNITETKLLNFRYQPAN